MNIIRLIPRRLLVGEEDDNTPPQEGQGITLETYQYNTKISSPQLIVLGAQKQPHFRAQTYNLFVYIFLWLFSNPTTQQEAATLAQNRNTFQVIYVHYFHKTARKYSSKVIHIKGQSCSYTIVIQFSIQQWFPEISRSKNIMAIHTFM